MRRDNLATRTQRNGEVREWKCMVLAFQPLPNCQSEKTNKNRTKETLDRIDELTESDGNQIVRLEKSHDSKAIECGVNKIRFSPN